MLNPAEEPARPHAAPLTPILLKPIERRYEGAGRFQGVGVGGACVIRLEEREPQVRQIPASEADAEVGRLDSAIGEVKRQYEVLKRAEAMQNLDFHALDLIAYPAVPTLLAGIIRNSHVTAQEAVWRHFQEFARSFGPSFHDQAHEILQLMADLIDVLEPGGESRLDSFKRQIAASSGDIILVTDCLSPQELLHVDRSRVKGVILGSPGVMRHVGPIFRHLFPGAPLILDPTAKLSEISSGSPMIVDGRTGLYFVNPSEQTRAAYQPVIQALRNDRPKVSLRSHAPKSKDGVTVRFTADVVDAALSGEVADANLLGVGLFRTELPILQRGKWLSADEWCEEIGLVLKAVSPRPVVIRTFDFNRTDKFPPKADAERAALSGLTGIRLAENLFRPQLIELMEGAIRASILQGNQITFLLPMVLDVSDVRKARKTLTDAVSVASMNMKRPINPLSIELAAMLETSAAFRLAEPIMQQVNSVNVGSNDGLRSVLDGDSNKSTSAFYHPAWLMELAHVVSVGQRLRKPVRICGEMPNDPANTPLLVGVGARDWVLGAHAVEAVNSQLARCEVGPCEDLAHRIMNCGDGDVALELSQDFLAKLA